ncbi:sugar phosphate nucleotidyltransferase [Gemmatimonadota bacterium]
MKNTMTLILGGGRGSRLYPLTRYRSKPAVPLGGKFRLVDVPISNAIHAGLHRIFVLTQFNSASLHRHISHTYTFSHISNGFVDILAAAQTPAPHDDWYEGTADAVRKTLSHLEGYDIERVLILSGDQLYRINFEDVIAKHVERGAEVTVAGNLVAPAETGALGIMKVDESGRIIDFVEKPDSTELISGFEIPASLYPAGSHPEEHPYAASMGIYIWELEALKDALEANPEATDFGHEIIPAAIGSRSVYACLFDGYWEDIGTIGSFYEANLSLARPDPPFEFYHQGRAIITHPRYLPAARVRTAIRRHPGRWLRPRSMLHHRKRDRGPVDPPERRGDRRQRSHGCRLLSRREARRSIDPASRHRGGVSHPAGHHRQGCPYRPRCSHRGPGGCRGEA